MFVFLLWLIVLLQYVRMMATVPMSSSSLLPLLGTLEDDAAGVSEQTDAYLTIAKWVMEFAIDQLDYWKGYTNYREAGTYSEMFIKDYWANLFAIFSRLSGEDGRQFFPLIVKHFSRLGKAFQVRTGFKKKISLHSFVCFYNLCFCYWYY